MARSIIRSCLDFSDRVGRTQISFVVGKTVNVIIRTSCSTLLYGQRVVWRDEEI